MSRGHSRADRQRASVGAGSSRCRLVAHAFVRSRRDLETLAARASRDAFDTVEIDVLHHAGELFVAHALRDLEEEVSPLTFDEVLRALAATLPAHIGLIVDVKNAVPLPALLNSLTANWGGRGLLISSMDLPTVRQVRGLAPSVPVGWSVPRASRDYLAHAATRPLALAALAFYRLVLPRRVVREIRRTDIEAIMAYWRVVTPRLLRALEREGADLYAWTVDDAKVVTSLNKLGVTAVITNKLAEAREQQAH